VFGHWLVYPRMRRKYTHEKALACSGEFEHLQKPGLKKS
jgi:hypothetical protein